MYEEQFYKRLIALRNIKGVSAREMSLAIGQTEGYINKIENKKNLPSLSGFFYICEYLGVTPREFFDDEKNDPVLYNNIIKDLMSLNEEKIENICNLIRLLK